MLDLSGRKFGRLTVLGLSHRDKYRNSYWKCLCKCGSVKDYQRSGIVNGTTKSCGCLHSEKLKQRFTTHGKYLSEIYSCWRNMKSRCNNPNHPVYDSYGGRGIKVCKRWEKFDNFYEDMGERPKGLSLERSNNDKGYSLKNCCWATKKEQANNRRENPYYSRNRR